MGEELITLKVPDLGGFDQVEVIEVLVSKGDSVKKEDPLLTLESDKAAMDIPAEQAGTVEEVLVKAGDQVAQGDAMLKLRPSEPAPEEEAPETKKEAEPQKKAPEEEASAPTEPRSESPKEEPQTSDAPEGAVDLLVLGGGPGGYTAAFRAADLGLKVVLVEDRPQLGGVCLNVGCIPTKALLHAARVAEQSRQAEEMGLQFGPPKIDFKKLQQWKQGIVTKLVGGLGQLAQQRKVEVITGRGRFSGPHELEIQGEKNQSLSFKQAIIATGSRPVRLPDLPESERIVDSSGALAFETLPKSLLIVGGGVIGVEFASLFSAFGSEVHLVEQADQLLPGVDPALAKGLKKALKTKLEGIHLKASLKGVSEESDHLVAQIEGLEEPLKVERMLVAVGRRPNSKDLGLENLGLEPNEKGLIEVDLQQRTSLSHLLAIGDLTPGPQLAHKATAEAKVAAEVAAGKKSAWDHRALPAVAYTEPEVAWVGLSEAEAKAQGLETETSSFPWSASGRALAEQASEGLTRLIFDKNSKRLVGAALLGRGAGELIGELALALEMDCEAGDLALSIHPHPTLSETLPLAAERFEGTITDLLPAKKR